MKATREITPKTPPEKIRVVTCNICNQKVRYVASDIKEIEGKDLSGRKTSREWVDCTECGAEIIFSKQ